VRYFHACGADIGHIGKKFQLGKRDRYLDSIKGNFAGLDTFDAGVSCATLRLSAPPGECASIYLR